MNFSENGHGIPSTTLPSIGEDEEDEEDEDARRLINARFEIYFIHTTSKLSF